MQKILLISLICLFTLSNCESKQNKENIMKTNSKSKTANNLINETSPYLLQHAYNPVNWYPWGDKALDKAKKENKLLLISIGYSACHWCHVMEHESFEDSLVAKFMNDNFICIKVDREERPDIDKIYMNAVQLITGRGGWPLNCIALPDGRPIYGGTYFPKDNWLDMLSKILDFTINNPERTQEQANALTNGIRSKGITISKNKAEFSNKNLETIFSNWLPSIDFKNGGQKGAPKFPMPIGLEFLLNYNNIFKDSISNNAISITLTKMANGGIYDHLAGGFARYSTDDIWKVPHFEKMLYDNAQLISLYSKAYQNKSNSLYKSVVKETIKFLNSELSNKYGSYFSSLDADSEGEEGKFYVWTYLDIKNILGNNSKLFLEYFNISEQGNWEDNKNILLVNKDLENFAKANQLSIEEFINYINSSKNILLNSRNKRIRPGLDDKTLTAWNALTISAFVDAYNSFGNTEFLNSAISTAEFLINNMINDDFSLYRNFKNNTANINGFLDDYAFTISAFISLYQTTFNSKYLDYALNLTEYSLKHFWDVETKMFFYTSDIDNKLVSRELEIIDNVIPSSNSEMAKVLFLLGHLYYKDNFIDISKTMLNNVKNNILTGNSHYANWAILLSWFSEGIFEVAILGEDFRNKRSEFNSYFLPNVIFAGGNSEGNLPLLKDRLVLDTTTIYVCKNKVCKIPVNSSTEAVKQIIE